MRGYRSYGLTILSDFDLPEYLPAEVSGAPDLTIRRAPEALAEWERGEPVVGRFIPARSGGHVLRLEGVAVYHVRDGREIAIAVEPDADPGMVRLFTIGSAMGMLMHQRGVFVLHGATIALNGEARMFVGDSGAGKSTLAARLGRAGCTVFGDDTMALWDMPAQEAPTGMGGRWLWPGSRVFKLWSDSIEAIGLETEGLLQLGNRVNKFYVPNPDPEGGLQAAAEAGARLVEILVLEVGDGPPRIEPLDGIRALEAVALNTYRGEYVRMLDQETEHFRQCADLVRDVPVGKLIRPWNTASFDAIVALVRGRWGGGRDRQGLRADAAEGRG
jgi:hypothetical protein